MEQIIAGMRARPLKEKYFSLFKNILLPFTYQSLAPTILFKIVLVYSTLLTCTTYLRIKRKNIVDKSIERNNLKDIYT